MGLEVNKDKHDNSKNAVSTAKRGSDVMQLKEPIAFCVKCGAKNQPDSVYCYSCGNKLA